MNDDKKKMAVLGALGAVVLAIGAFSFMKGDPAPVDASASADEVVAEEAPKTVDEDGKTIMDPTLSALVTTTYAARDPFQAPASASTGPTTTPEAQPEPPTTSSTPRPNRTTHVEPWTPPIGGSLPTGNGGGMGLPNPDGAVYVPQMPSYRVKGVLVGEKSIAVFEDEQGNQKLVPLGGSIDGETTVTKIEKGKVTVRHRGKDRVLIIDEVAG